jgi:hypothetical protein
MAIWQQPRSLVRVIIYLLVLAVVVLLLRNHSALLPAAGLEVLRVRQADRWEDRWGQVTAAPGERLLIVTVRLRASQEVITQLRPEHFLLVDTSGQDHHPSEQSSLFQSGAFVEEGGSFRGILIFHLPRAVEGESLSFYPEGLEYARDHQSEDTGQKSGP